MRLLNLDLVTDTVITIVASFLFLFLTSCFSCLKNSILSFFKSLIMFYFLFTILFYVNWTYNLYKILSTTLQQNSSFWISNPSLELYVFSIDNYLRLKSKESFLWLLLFLQLLCCFLVTRLYPTLQRKKLIREKRLKKLKLFKESLGNTCTQFLNQLGTILL
jgi:accessory gene regulator protein AgrB